MNRPVCFENGMLTKLTADSPDPMKLLMQITFVLRRFQSLWCLLFCYIQRLWMQTQRFFHSSTIITVNRVRLRHEHYKHILKNSR